MKFPKVRMGIIAGATIAGAGGGFVSGQPGHRMDYAKEGALAGAGIGTGVVLAPRLAKWGAKKTATIARASAKRGYESGKVMFRRIRGRIIPIRTK